MPETTDPHNESRRTQKKSAFPIRDRLILTLRQKFWFCCTTCASLALHLLVSYIFVISFTMRSPLVITSEPVSFWLPPLFFAGEPGENKASAPDVLPFPKQKTASRSPFPNPKHPDKSNQPTITRELSKNSTPSPAIEEVEVSVAKAPLADVIRTPVDTPLAKKVVPATPPVKAPPQESTLESPPHKTALQKSDSSAKVAMTQPEEQVEEKKQLKEKVDVDAEKQVEAEGKADVGKKSGTPPVEDPQYAAKVETSAVKSSVNQPSDQTDQPDADTLAIVKMKQESATNKAQLELEKREKRQVEAKARSEKPATEEKTANEEKDRQAEEAARLKKLALEEKNAKKREAEEKARQEKLARKERAVKEKSERLAVAKERQEKTASEEKARQEKLAAEAEAAKEEKRRQAEESARLKKLAIEEKSAKKRVVEEKARQDKISRKEKARQEKLAAEEMSAKEKNERLAAVKERQEKLVREEKARQEKLADEAEAAKEEKRRQAEESARLKKLAIEEKSAKKREAEEKARQDKLSRNEKARQEKLAIEEKVAKEKSERQTAAIERKEKLAREEKARQEKLAAEAKAAKEEKRRQAEEKAERERAAVEKAAKELEIREREQQAAEKARLEQLDKDEKTKGYIMKRLAKLKAERELAVATKAVNDAENTAKAPSQRQGLAIPQVKGDIKLLVVGQAPKKIMINFREFKLNRRNRPFSRAELKQREEITPISVSPGEHKFEYVIEKAREGVYTLAIDHTPGKPSTFSLLLYEGTGQVVRKELTSHTSAQKRLIVKILMPEGILWDDESVFSGSMEDSEAVTRFNSDSGLVWKELNAESE